LLLSFVTASATAYSHPLSLHDALPISAALRDRRIRGVVGNGTPIHDFFTDTAWQARVPRITRDTLAHLAGVSPGAVFEHLRDRADRKSTRLNSSHVSISYAVFCLKKKQ